MCVYMHGVILCQDTGRNNSVKYFLHVYVSLLLLGKFAYDSR